MGICIGRDERDPANIADIKDLQKQINTLMNEINALRQMTWNYQKIDLRVRELTSDMEDLVPGRKWTTDIR